MSTDRIDSPDDLPPPPDLDFPAEQADRDNDAAAIGHAPRYVHRSLSREQLEAAIHGATPIDCGLQLDPCKGAVRLPDLTLLTPQERAWLAEAEAQEDSLAPALAASIAMARQS